MEDNRQNGAIRDRGRGVIVHKGTAKEAPAISEGSFRAESQGTRGKDRRQLLEAEGHALQRTQPKQCCARSLLNEKYTSNEQTEGLADSKLASTLS